MTRGRGACGSRADFARRPCPRDGGREDAGAGARPQLFARAPLRGLCGQRSGVCAEIRARSAAADQATTGEGIRGLATRAPTRKNATRL